MRVIAGSARGRRLAGPPAGTATRPTSDKVREAVFDILGPARVAGARVLDLYAGTGALGIEALSRGATHATFVEADRGLARTIARNLETVGFGDRALVRACDVRRAQAVVATMAPYDLVLIDPPYGRGLDRDALALVARPAVLAPGAMVVLEHAARDAAATDASGVLVAGRTRTYGDTALTFYRAGGDEDPALAPDDGG